MAEAPKDRTTEAVTAKPARLWLVGAIVALIALGAWLTSTGEAETTTSVMTGQGRPQLFDFGMSVCSQCKRMRPVMERADRQLGACLDVHVLDIRVEANERLAERYRMRAIPFILLVDGEGRELWRHEGFVDFPDISRAIDRHLGISPGRSCARNGE